MLANTIKLQVTNIMCLYKHVNLEKSQTRKKIKRTFFLRRAVLFLSVYIYRKTVQRGHLNSGLLYFNPC